MFVLIWMTLLFSVSGSNADTGVSMKSETSCKEDNFCITLSDGEITAEAGLCVVIPCSFTTSSSFAPQNIVWFKCEPSKQRCGDLDVIFSRNSYKIQHEFRGRVSQLEPDIFHRNCSIIINDLTASDSGSYQLRVNGLNWRGYSDRFQYNTRSTVYVKDLTQKPAVMVPPLIEGQQASLTCTAPGLCSGSPPEITWMWSGGEREIDSYITGNITDFKTERLTAFTQRHSSTLTFTPSAQHHGANITCKVSFTEGASTEETVTINVTYVKEAEITGNTSVREGEPLHLTCKVESIPPSFVTWATFSNNTMLNGSEADVQVDTPAHLAKRTDTYLQEGVREAALSILNMTANDSGWYICTAKHLNNTLIKKVNVEVIYMRAPVITGNTTLTKGDTLNLTCSVESFPPSHITWSILGSDTDQQNDTESAELVIPNVQTENSGKYICTAKHQNTTVTVFTDVTVTLFRSIFENSGCEIRSGVLTCVCISEGFPLPTMKWPLLSNYTEYSVMTTVKNHTVNSTITLTVKDLITSAECISSNGNREAKGNLIIQNNTSKAEEKSRVLKMFSQLEVILAFLIGVLLSAVLCLLATKCHRQRRNLDHTLEMVTNQEGPLIDANQEVEDDQTYEQEVTEAGGAVAEEEAALHLDGGPNEVEYASIDFSVLKRKAPKKKETTTTEYAEIKRGINPQGNDNGGEEDGVLEAKEEEMVEEVEDYGPEEEEGEEMAVYSNMKDLINDI
ncbi:sialic acid-binding Ig-like lectin 10 isoform X2 [Cheilinus undulatus]|uniref:sialic acid-binding Ig-like lectin 10 isoform X2 n=1 Tax=Cheilinus undulatus TaxID=241271 RepID=UPI001BD63A4E|nr:sialic acid-binding Ig-like lectin 10 isoform X2 [Cheilinus undulatus]